MKLLVTNARKTLKTTISDLFVDGVFECHICEDRYRPPGEPKVPGETCIPAGTYAVEITNSPRFSEIAGHPVDLPLVKDVPGFAGIRIHTGNRDTDTEGCLLPGRKIGTDCVLESRLAFDPLFRKLAAAQARHEPITIEIVRD